MGNNAAEKNTHRYTVKLAMLLNRGNRVRFDKYLTLVKVLDTGNGFKALCNDGLIRSMEFPADQKSFEHAIDQVRRSCVIHHRNAPCEARMEC